MVMRSLENGYSCIMDQLTWYPIMYCCPCFLLGLTFTPLIVVIVSSRDKPLFKQSFMTLNTSSAISSLCAQFSHIAPWSGVNSIMVKATMISLGVCGSGPMGHITYVPILSLESNSDILTANPINRHTGHRVAMINHLLSKGKS